MGRNSHMNLSELKSIRTVGGNQLPVASVKIAYPGAVGPKLPEPLIDDG
jgi:hypothetical protein